jgi:O-antigen/teichoic acid export membrane protein
LLRRVGSLARSEFVRNVTILASGTALAQVVTVLAMPLLTRLYAPAEFGAFAVLLSLLGPPALIAGLRYEVAILLPKRHEEAANLMLLTCSIVLAFSALSLIVVLFWSPAIAATFGSPEIAPLMWFLPMAIFFAGMQAAAESWSTRTKDFGALSTANVVRSLATVALQLAGGLLAGGAKALLTGRILGGALGGLVVIGRLIRSDGRKILEAASLSVMRQMARLHWRFVAYNVPSTVLNSVSNMAPALLLAYYFDAAAAGFFFFCFRLLEMPRDLIGTAVRRVFHQKTAELRNDGQDLSPIFARTTGALFAAPLLPALIVAAFGPELFSLVFGAEWARAGSYAQWLVVLWITSFCNVPAVTLFFVLNLQGLSLAIEIGAIVLRIGAIALGAWFGDDLLSIALYSIAGIVTNIGIIGLVFWQIRQDRPAVVGA